MALPTYTLTLNRATITRDIAQFLTTHNINMGEIEEYVNAIRDAVDGSGTSTGVTETRVREIIQSERYRFLIPAVWTQNTLPIDPTNTELGTMTRTENTDGSVTVTVTNVKNTHKVLTDIRTFTGEVAYPNITISESFITIIFDRIEDLSATSGHVDSSTDPNNKFLYIL